MSKSVNFKTMAKNRSMEQEQRNQQESERANPSWGNNLDFIQNRVDGHEVPKLYNDAVPTTSRNPSTGKFTSEKLYPSQNLGPDFDGLSGMSSGDPQDKYFESVATYSNPTQSGNYPLTETRISGAGVTYAPMNLGKPYLGSEFFDFLQRKKELAILQDYELWKIAQINTSNPAIREWWKKVHPEVWQKKKDHFNRQLEIEKKYAEIQMRGIESEEDLRWLYLYQTNQKQQAGYDIHSKKDMSNFKLPSKYAPADRLVWMDQGDRNAFSDKVNQVQFPILHN